MCRFRRELSNEYLLATFGFDTAENELSKVCRRKQAIPTPGHESGSAYPRQEQMQSRAMSRLDGPGIEFVHLGVLFQHLQLDGKGVVFFQASYPTYAFFPSNVCSGPRELIVLL